MRRQRHDQLDGMKTARLLNPLYVKANSASSLDILAMAETFRVIQHSSDLVAAMKQELAAYNAAVAAIPAKSDRMKQDPKSKKAVDTFCISSWWRSHKTDLPNLVQLLKLVGAHSPNSCVPERVFLSCPTALMRNSGQPMPTTFN